MHAPDDAVLADTPFGPIEVLDRGTGDPVLVVHGSPGGCDQGQLLGRFLLDEGFRVIAPSRPGYLGTALTDDNATPDAQAALHLALLDALGLDGVPVLCWSGGGPSTYRLAAQHPERVTRIAALAAVSHDYEFATGLEASLMAGRFGHWLIAEMAKHSAKSLVSSTMGEEGDLTKEQLRELTEQIWADDTKRAFVLDLAATVAGRTVGLHNDHAQFPQIDDLGLAAVTAPVLLVHGTVDTDVPPEHSAFALEHLPSAELHPVEGGTHLAAWTDPTSDDLHARITAFLRAG